MTSEQLRAAEALEAKAPLRIAGILAELSSRAAQLRALEAVVRLVEAESCEPGILQTFLRGGENESYAVTSPGQGDS